MSSIPTFQGYTRVTCQSSAICVASGNHGKIGFSTNRAQPITLPAAHGGSLHGISCPTVSVCVAVGGAHAYVSRDPRRAASWKAATIPVGAAADLTAASCSATTLCAAVDAAGDVFLSTNPRRRRLDRANSSNAGA